MVGFYLPFKSQFLRTCCLQGLWPNYVKVVPSIAIAFVTYEQVSDYVFRTFGTQHCSTRLNCQCC